MLKQQQYPFHLFYPQHYCYLILPLHTIETLTTQQNQNYQEEQLVNKNPNFMQIFQQELKIRHKTSYVKEWTEEQEQLLLSMGKQCKNWNELSRKFNGKPAKVCHRKYRKLLHKQTKWPKQYDNIIKQLRQVENKTWIEIQSIIKSSIFYNTVYNAKKIRERYKNYLEVQVNRKKWQLSQDLALWTLVKQQGKTWKQISNQFPHRTGLQLRNRFYKFLQPISKKLTQKLQINSFNLNI